MLKKKRRWNGFSGAFSFHYEITDVVCILQNVSDTLPNKNYTIQVWLTTLLLGPTFSILQLKLQDPLFLFLFILLGLFFSLPVLLLHFAAFKAIADADIAVIIIKLLLALITIAGTIGIFWMYGIPFPEHIWDRSFYLSYSLAILLSSFVFRIRKQKSAPASTRLTERY